MAQNQNTGRQADAWGRRCACAVAAAIGVRLSTTISNEAIFNNQRVVIKCAHRKTDSVGLSHKMISRLDAVLGAFENPDGKFTILRLPVQTCANAMEPTRSKGASAGKVGIVKRSLFDEQGTLVGVFRL